MLDFTPLFESEDILLTVPNPQEDGPIEARWYQDPNYSALIQREPVRPLTVEQVRKKQTSSEKDERQFCFAIRLRPDHRLVGFVEISRILWPIRVGWLDIRIGDPDDRGKGYGCQALELMLRYAFDELNLNKIICLVNGYNQAARQFFEKAGFVLEVRQREAILRYNQRWDLLWLGLTRAEWEERRATTGGAE